MRSNRTKKLILINSVLLAVLVIGFVYAWFAVNFNSKVDTDDVEVVADSALEISLDGSNWSSYLYLNETNVLKNLDFRDITGIGDGKFLRPTLTQFSGFATVGDDAQWSTPQSTDGTQTADNTADYVKFDIHMRSADQLNVYLGQDSGVTPISTKLLGVTSAEAGLYNKSTYGNFSKDLVAGAVRVSATDTSNSRLFTWIPCPNIYLNTKYDESVGVYNIITNASPSSTYSDGSNPYEHYYYDSSHNLNTLTGAESDKLLTELQDTTTSPANQKLASLTKKNADGYYYDKITVYVWLEGCDNEARRAFAGGKFNISLMLDAQDYIVPSP